MAAFKALLSIMLVGEPEWPPNVPAMPMYEERNPPLWLRSALAYNKDHVNRTRHRIDIKWLKGPDFPLHQINQCDQKDGDVRNRCYYNYHRENCNWYKFHLILQYLENPDNEYILYIDSDVILKTHPHADPITDLVNVLNSENRDILMADEDWQCTEPRWQNEPKCHHRGMVNGGLILIRNCEWSKQFFKNMLGYQEKKLCNSNEQTCLRDTWNKNRSDIRGHMYIASGMEYNKHPTRPLTNWMRNDSIKVVHFMGAAKPGLTTIDLQHRGACPYDMCVDLERCSSALELASGKYRSKGYALVITHDLHRPSGKRLHEFHAMKSLLLYATKINADKVLLVPKDTIAKFSLTNMEKSELEQHGFKIIYVDWVIPPSLHSSIPSKTCRRQQYMRIHALGLVQYSAVLVVDGSMIIKSDISKILRCAAQNRILFTNSVITPLSSGILAVRPSKEIFSSALYFAKTVNLNENRWIEDRSIGSFKSHECGTGFFWAMFFESKYFQFSNRAFESTGYTQFPSSLFVDRCIWNRRAEDDITCSSAGKNCDSVKIVYSGECKPILQ